MAQLSEQILEAIQAELQQLSTEHSQLLVKHEQLKHEFTEFTYIISHDLKAHLRAIMSLSDWLNHDYHDKLDAAAQEMLQLMTQRVQRLNNMLEGVLKFSRIGRFTETCLPVNINELIDHLLKELAPPPHYQIIIPKPLPTLIGDPLRLEQLFAYLLDNAIKYNQHAEAKIQLTAQDLETYWQFQLQDNGPGIPTKEFERVFQIFQTLQPMEEAGTGMGLTLAKKIVEYHGGHIWLDVTARSGTTVCFTWPKTDSHEQ